MTRWAVAATGALGLGLVSFGPSAHADLQSSIDAKRAALGELNSAIGRDTAEIDAGSGGLERAEHTLAVTESALAARQAQLNGVETQLLAARNRLTEVENRLEASTSALEQNLVATYEGDTPDVLTVVVEAHGFADLLNQINYLHLAAQHDADIVSNARAARAEVTKQADALGALEQRDRQLAAAVAAQNSQAQALETALLRRHVAILTARADKAGEAHGVTAELSVLEKREASIIGQAAPGTSGIQIDTGGMVQPPPGAPAAVAEVIAAGNAIATLPYVYGGGHASFHADAYDCSGSVSYALAAAGLVSAPMTSGQFESWGEPGPGKWITVYANAGHVFMYVAGWRFDTVALAESGTRWAQSGTDTSGFVVRHPAGL